MERDKLDAIRQLGFTYDSSKIRFAQHPLYRNLDLICFEQPEDLVYVERGFSEYEIPTLELFGYSIPISGGGYLRLFPFWLLRILLRLYARKHENFTIYVHPFELTSAKLPLPEESRYAGKGVHYCELCDGHMYQNKVIAVMGGGNAAVDAANFLSKYARKLYLIHRSEIRADEVSWQRLQENPKAEVFLQTEVKSLHGEGRLESIEIFDKAAGETRQLPVDGIFVNIGVVPNTELFADELSLTPSGRIAAGEDCRTSIPGVFAAGDVREKEIRQLTTAAADGTTAALLAEKYIVKLKEGN
jgi:hypothetical protein